jgi:plastocyanin
MIRAALIVILAAGLAVATTGDAATPPSVQIKQFAFIPGTLTVPAGTTVTWTNADDETHTVTDKAYTSTGLEHNGTYSHRFTTPGTYTYFCMLHPHMTATVVVQ